MFYTLILENESSRQLNLSETANRLMFSKIEGLSPPAGTISTTFTHQYSTGTDMNRSSGGLTAVSSFHI